MIERERGSHQHKHPALTFPLHSTIVIMALTTRFLMSALIILGIVAHSEASKPGVDGRLAAVLLRDEDNYNHGFPGAVCTFTFVKGCACNGDTSVCKCTDSGRNDVCTTNTRASARFTRRTPPLMASPLIAFLRILTIRDVSAKPTRSMITEATKGLVVPSYI